MLPLRYQILKKLQLIAALYDEIRPQLQAWFLFLWASEFAMDWVYLRNWQVSTFWGNIYLARDDTCILWISASNSVVNIVSNFHKEFWKALASLPIIVILSVVSG